MKETNRKFKFKYINENWIINKTRHVYESRAYNEYSRDEFIDESRYIEIFKNAIRKGLSSFRNKGQILINVPNYNGTFSSILCELNSKNIITIITVYRCPSKFKWWTTFIKVRNRINIIHEYVIPKFNKEERLSKKYDKLQNEIDMEINADMNYFLNAMKDIERFN